MKNNDQVVSHVSTAKKPLKAKVSDAEFRRRLNDISDWRKKRLDQFAPKIRVEVFLICNSSLLA